MSSGVGRVTRLNAGGGTGGKKLGGDTQTGDADAPTTLLTASQNPPSEVRPWRELRQVEG